MSATSEPQVLRIGLLGAARIAPAAICIPALALNHKLVAVGARDLQKSEVFAQQWMIEKAYGSYEEVINDPEIDVIYNGLPNSHHGFWNIQALNAGKHVLSEKPFGSNLAEVQWQVDVARKSSTKIMEAFHNRYHPTNQRAIEIAKSGEIGEITSVYADLAGPVSDKSDIRYQLDLAGGAMMDMGCYTIHMQRHLGLALFGEEPTVVSAKAKEFSPGVDQMMTVELKYKNGATGTGHCDLDFTHLQNECIITGTKGSIKVPSYVLPGLDDRVIVTVNGKERTEYLGRISTYSYQLQAFAGFIRGTNTVLTGVEDSLKNAAMIDEIYRAAGMNLRPAPLMKL